jgi:hypothetical protein
VHQIQQSLLPDMQSLLKAVTLCSSIHVLQSMAAELHQLGQ